MSAPQVRRTLFNNDIEDMKNPLQLIDISFQEIDFCLVYTQLRIFIKTKCFCSFFFFFLTSCLLRSSVATFRFLSYLIHENSPGGEGASLVDYAEFFLDCREEKKYKEHLLRAVRVKLDFTVDSFTGEFSRHHLLGKTGKAS